MTCPQNRWRIILAGATVAILFFAMASTRSLATEGATPSATAASDVDPISSIDWDVTSKHPEGGLVPAQASSPRTVLPTGWRRTTRGWERADAWDHSDGAAISFATSDSKTYQRRFAAVGGAPPQTVSQWMAWDRAREPVWANKLLGGLKLVHPIVIACFLIAAAILITRLSERTLAEFNEV